MANKGNRRVAAAGRMALHVTPSFDLFFSDSCGLGYNVLMAMDVIFVP